MKKNDIKAWIDEQLLERDGDLSAREAVDYAVDAKMDLPEAYVVLVYHQRKARYESVAPIQFLLDYVHAKFVAYANGKGDKGARGDAVEAIVRYWVKNRFITYSDVMTHRAEDTDVSSKRGLIEVGHNGKTFNGAFVPADIPKAELNEKNYMNGQYQILIYGAFRKDFTEDDILNKVLRTMRVFENKYEFPHAIAGRNGLASGWNVAGQKATVQYNDALRIRFKEYCDEHKIPTLGEWLKK